MYEPANKPRNETASWETEDTMTYLTAINKKNAVWCNEIFISSASPYSWICHPGNKCKRDMLNVVSCIDWEQDVETPANESARSICRGHTIHTTLLIPECFLMNAQCLCVCLVFVCVCVCLLSIVCVPAVLLVSLQRRGRRGDSLVTCCLLWYDGATWGSLRDANVSTSVRAFIQHKCHVLLQGCTMSLLFLWIMNIRRSTSVQSLSSQVVSSVHEEIIQWFSRRLVLGRANWHSRSKWWNAARSCGWWIVGAFIKQA